MLSVPSAPDDADAPLTLTTLGGAGLFSPAGVELLGAGKPLALIIYLACCPSRSARREQLLTLLWADLPPEKARHALRQTLWFLRQTLGVDRLKATGPELTLEGRYLIDRERFLEAIEGRELESAASCYQGNFLEDFAVPGGLDFEHWADVERQRLREAFLRSCEHLARQWMDQGRAREAVALARRVRDAAPGVERAWRLLLEALRSADDRLGFAMESAALLKHFSNDGREPEGATRALLEGDSDGAIHPGESRRQLNPALVGREREFSSVIQAWEEARKSGGRHIHLTAPPGLGKSRLLQEVHRRLRGLGARAIVLRANPGDHAIPFSFAGEIVRALVELPGAAGVSPATASSLIALHPPLSGRFNASADVASGDDTLHHRSAALAELLEVVCDETPVALLLDDLHWADRPSRQLLLPLITRLERTHLLLVSSTRPSTELAAFGQASQTMDLSPIAVSHIAELLSSLGQLPENDWSRELPAKLREATAGSPLLILEALQLALDRGLLELDQSWHCAHPEELYRLLGAGGAMKSRIDRLDRESREVLLLLATGGVPLSTTEIESASRGGRSAVEASLQSLEQAGMVSRSGESWQPIHDEIAAHSTEHSNQSERRAAHAGLGLSLLARPGKSTVDLARAGQHLAAAGERGPLRNAFVRYVRLTRQEGDRRRLGFLAQQFLDGRPEAEINELVQTMGRLNRLRYSAGTRAMIGAGLAMGMMGVALLGVAWWRRPDAMLMIRVEHQHATDSVFQLPLRRSEWSGDEPFRINRLTEVGQPVRVRGVTAWSASPDGSAWYYVREVDNLRTTDIFRKDSRSDSTPIAQYRRDDHDPTASPDGGFVVFTTSKYSRDAHDDNYDLAIMNLGTGEVLQLTSGPGMDQGAHYSPDGLLIAFTRNRSDRSVCWMVPQPGEPEHCLANTPRIVVVGWLDNSTVLGIDSRVEPWSLVSIDVPSGDETRLRWNVYSASLSPDGRWVAFKNRVESGRERWLVAPVGELTMARELVAEGLSSSELSVYWEPAHVVIDPVTSIRIGNPPRQIRLKVTYRLGLIARTRKGRESDAIGAWISRDTSVASIDSAGVITPRQPGRVTIVARSGHFADSVSIGVTTAFFHEELDEDWSAGITRNWIGFGDPYPLVAAWPAGGLAFLNNGEGSYGSGAYTRTNWPALEGIGIEAQMSIRVTRDNWQKVSLALVGALDSARLGDWDHRTGSFPRYAMPNDRICMASYPGLEGSGSDTLITFTNSMEPGRTRATAGMSSGRIFRILLQVFPDGRCGVALDGTPVWLSERRIDLNKPMAVELGYSSYDTKALIGPLTVWRGVRPVVPWGDLQPVAGAAKKH